MGETPNLTKPNQQSVSSLGAEVVRLGLSVGRKAQEPQGKPECDWASLNYRVSVDAFMRAADRKKQSIKVMIVENSSGS